MNIKVHESSCNGIFTASKDGIINIQSTNYTIITIQTVKLLQARDELSIFSKHTVSAGKGRIIIVNKRLLHSKDGLSRFTQRTDK